jgi:hypothetical protein
MTKSIYSIAHNVGQLELIVDQLVHTGFSSKDISILFSDQSGKGNFEHLKKTKMPEGAAAGAGGGGLLGGAEGWLAGIGTLAIPGVGPLIAAGPILAALSGVAVGATLGGIIGIFIGLGIPEYEAKRYEGKMKQGNILISVDSESEEEIERAKEIFQDAGATDISYTHSRETSNSH